MGCSASRLDTFLEKAIEDSSFSLSSSSSTPSSSSLSTKPRSIWAPLVHHPAIHKGDSHHIVSLTSSTYGSLDNHHKTTVDGGGGESSGQPSPDSVINTWELMEGLEEIEENCKFDNDLKVKSLNCCDFNDAQKIPNLKLGFNHGLSDDLKVKSLSSGDLSDAQKIPNLRLGFNHGLNDDLKVKSLSSCDFKDAQKIPNLILGLNFAENDKKLSDDYVFVEMPNDKFEGEEMISKPLWKLLSEEALLAKMDPNVAASYQKALYNNNNRSICPTDVRDGYQKALSDRKLGYNVSSVMNTFVSSSPSPVAKKCKSVEECSPVDSSLSPVAVKCKSVEECCPVDLSPSPVAVKCKNVECSPVVLSSKEDNAFRLGGCVDKIVLYFTSLRGIRRTYEDCCTVRLILKGCRVMVDERDISMDSSFRKELQSALGGKVFSLPQLFIRGKHVGGVDEIKRMHETGELERLLDGFPILDFGFVCDDCGDVRFIPCSNCSGSRKVFLEEEGQTMRCPDCNENGLVRCPACCS